MYCFSQITKERVNMKHIKLELLQLDMQQTELERKGTEVEQKLRHWDGKFSLLSNEVLEH